MQLPPQMQMGPLQGRVWCLLLYWTSVLDFCRGVFGVCCCAGPWSWISEGAVLSLRFLRKRHSHSQRALIQHSSPPGPPISKLACFQTARTMRKKHIQFCSAGFIGTRSNIEVGGLGGWCCPCHQSVDERFLCFLRISNRHSVDCQISRRPPRPPSQKISRMKKHELSFFYALGGRGGHLEIWQSTNCRKHPPIWQSTKTEQKKTT